MTAPTPKTKFDQIIGELNAMVGSVPDEFTLKRLENEGNKLLNVDRVEAFLVLGAVASFRCDFQAVHKYHHSAIEWSAGEATAYYNYAMSLYHLEDYSSAFMYAKTAHERQPLRASLILMIRSAASLGLKSTLRSLLDEYERFAGEPFEFADGLSSKDFIGVVRSDVMDILDEDIKEYSELWARLADS